LTSSHLDSDLNPPNVNGPFLFGFKNGLLVMLCEINGFATGTTSAFFSISISFLTSSFSFGFGLILNSDCPLG
jgi:hypothetical protein